jgi:hypothetical protein
MERFRDSKAANMHPAQTVQLNNYKKECLWDAPKRVGAVQNLLCVGCSERCTGASRSGEHEKRWNMPHRAKLAEPEHKHDI